MSRSNTVPIPVILLLIAVGAIAASSVGLSWPAMLLFSILGFALWSAGGSLSRRYYMNKHHLEVLSREDIPTTLWLLTLGGVAFGLFDGGAQDVKHGDMATDLTGDDVSSMDGGGWGGSAE